jgi:signal transduction histidine kinase
MIWQSIAVMTVIDIIIIAVTLLAYWCFYKYRQTLKQLRLVPGVSLCMGGLAVIALFYLADLATMLVLPRFFMQKAQAMEIMAYLHLNLSWIVVVLGVGLIVAGLIYLMRILFPKLDMLLEELQRHRDHLEEEVTGRTLELTAANRELESYSYSIAHDLRAPLRSVTSFCQVFLEDAGEKLNADEKDSLQRVVSASKYMAQLIDDILKLARITRSELKLGAVDLGALARAVVERLCESGLARNVACNIQDGLVATGDRKLLTLVLDNLIGNACKYTSKTEHARIEFGAKEKDGETVFFVKDNGVGFNMRHASKLFTPFQRLHKPEEFEGTGIGLATVQRVIHRHGGRVWAKGEVDKGATFYFTLPRVRGQPVSAAGQAL